MIKNYLKVALRNLRKYKGYAFINVFGLALGIACCLLIILFVQDELGYDRFHEKADRIYRLAMETESSDRRFQYPSVGGGWAAAFVTDFPAVEQATRLFKPFGQVWLVKDDQRFDEDRFFWADSTVFEVFTFSFLKGTPEAALQEPNTVVLTEASARKFFGTTDVLDRTLGIEFGTNVVDFKIVGVLENTPENAHFHFDFLGSLPTLREQFGPQANAFLNNFTFTAFYTYLVVQEGYDIVQLEEQLPSFFEKYAGDQEFVKSLFIQPLTDIHLRSHLLNEIETNGNVSYIYVFSAIALLTLVIACINFMNLSTARSANRAREVGMRKVVGAERKDLIKQFLGESLLLAFVALIVGVLIAEAFLPLFNTLSGKSLDIGYVSNPFVTVSLLGIALFVGVFSGSYPALFLSAFQPMVVLRGKFQAGARSALLRKILVITQFAVSIFFLVGSGVIYSQLDFIRTAPVGFERQQRVVIPIPLPNDDNLRVRTIELLKQEYLQHPDIVNVAAASNVPGQLRGITRVRTTDMPEDQFQETTTVSIDHDYVRTMGIDVVEGRVFNAALSTDSTEAFLLNEAAAALLNLDDPVGQPLEWRNGLQDTPNTQVIDGTIIGVFKNLYFEPMYREIAPMLFRINPPNYFNLIAEVDPRNPAAAISFMEQTWRTLIPNRPFQYTFLDDDLAEIYQAEQQLSDVVKYLTMLAIFIACLGLFGLASFTAEQRTKEIGVRKTLGASVPGIVLLLSKEFTKLVVAAFVVAAPIGYIAMSKWLENFAYHVDISWGIFLLAGGLALIIAWLTVSYQSIRAALTNPVEALRYE
ncbi:MAG: ABC transporter permease [Rhodothermales bacterium]